ncbi:MAG: UvrD-helicase domain-containing protein [Anaerolineae bacterium]|nr:UvrD-helicase domain-containing protein [Anaerolineae bacterium]
MTSSDILAGLNEQQVEAVTAGEGPVLVLAGPGSGKTRVLTHRIAYLIEKHGVRPWHIMAVTFTNKAAREMENRIVGLLGDSGKIDGLSIGTFHATCARILRREADFTPPFSSSYTIFDTADQLAAMKRALADLNLDPKKNTPNSMLSRVSAVKNELLGPGDVAANDYRAEIFQRVYEHYNSLLRASNARDFDDLLMHTVLLFRNHPDVLERYQRRYPFILVDEFQDTNIAQYTLVGQLVAHHRNLFAVGDPDQSIYAFRGADHRNVQRFRQDFPDTQTILLEQNYRSHQAILDAAMGVIDRNPGRIRKQLFSKDTEGPLLVLKEAYNEDNEAQFIIDTIIDLTNRGEYGMGDFAIMYRTNAQSRALEEAFLRAGIPYRLVGATRFYARREVKDVLAFLRLIHNPSDIVSLQRVINLPPRGIGQKTQQTLDAWAQELDVTSGEALLYLLDEDPEDAPFSGRSRSTLARFAELLRSWLEQRDTLTPVELLSLVLEDTAYLNYLDDGSADGQSRVENVLELRGVASGYDGLDLTTFLEEVSLVADTDTRDDDTQAPTLLTLHSAKGLEFPVVFITGLEEGVLPHSRSIEAVEESADSSAIQEERRLLYVGITRTEQRLYMLYTFRRSLYGYSDTNRPSRFLYDIPESVFEYSDLRQRGQATTDARAYREMTTWAQTTTPRPPRSSKTKPARFKAGTVVWHKKYGEGVVVGSRARGDIEEVNVLFPGGSGEKTIMADFLKPVDQD